METAIAILIALAVLWAAFCGILFLFDCRWPGDD